MLAGIVEGEAASVRCLGGGGQRRVQVYWPDGRMGVVVVGAAAKWLPFYASITTECGIAQYQADAAALYRSQLEVCLPYLAGESRPGAADHAGVDPARIVGVGCPTFLAKWQLRSSSGRTVSNGQRL